MPALTAFRGQKLRDEWVAIGEEVRKAICTRVREQITDSQKTWDSLGEDVVAGLGIASAPKEELTEFWKDFGKEVRDRLNQQEQPVPDRERHRIFKEVLCEKKFSDCFSSSPGNLLLPYLNDLRKWLLQGNWEWRRLWQFQLENTWEPYWAAVPLGDPKLSLTISKQEEKFDEGWKNSQTELSQAWVKIPSQPEEDAFDTLNVGTWWGSFQQRLRIAIQAVKNTRTWQIPVAPGERSTISGQYSALHPNLNYQLVQRLDGRFDFREGGGLPEGSMRLFWLLMSKAYPGIFNGSERLNALELTKRMAWIYGDVAESLGIGVNKVVKRIQRKKSLLKELAQQWETQQVERFLYDRFICFPNLSSIAAARFIHDNPYRVRDYVVALEAAIETELGAKYKRIFERVARIRPTHIPRTDQEINPRRRKRSYLNGVMFSAKWLAEDLELDLAQTRTLRELVDRVQRDSGFNNGSPSDWWAIVLADGDGMGQYISGSKLEQYHKYIDKSVIDRHLPGLQELYNQKKRMGPATHVGLNRALLDFSNRLVPYLTEKRFCGKVIYSGGDDVMAVLPLEDLPAYLRSLRAAWSGKTDPENDFDCGDGYWRPRNGKKLEGLPHRPLFTMGNTATMSMGVVIAYKSVPLPTVLENLWSAESDRAKEMYEKDGICFRVIYGSGNSLEALMKGELLDSWWNLAQNYSEELSPILYRLAEELPKRADVEHPELFSLAAKLILERRDKKDTIDKIEEPMTMWIDAWSRWAHKANKKEAKKPGATPKDLGYLLRFTAFWVDKMVERKKWKELSAASSESQS